MSTYEDFVHVSTTGAKGWPSHSVAGDYLENSKRERLYTSGVIIDSLRKHHPKHHLSVTPAQQCDLLGYARSQEDVTVTPTGSKEDIKERLFTPPQRRYNDESGGNFIDHVVFGSFEYVFKGNKFLLYMAEGAQDGAYGMLPYNYLLLDESRVTGKSTAQKQVDELLKAATSWALELHNEVLVFDQGQWQKNADLWQNIQKAKWEDVILEKEKKDTIIEDVVGFFDAEKRYSEFNVPWKRGVIFYGPPGNGKTISTKALMRDVSKRTSPAVETLYVKTFTSYGGPEYGIRQIFMKARQMAPCLLIFEDIDSLVNVNVRAYFLNEVDGLESNHGILMIGSTNHLERLDPGIAKRPSRFDRKYLFDVPNRDERIQYCDYWRNKLKDNKKVYFPKEMSGRIADITADFSFAYLKEAFVAALLVIVAKSGVPVPTKLGDPLADNLLWNEIKRQVENLRKEMDDESTVAVEATPAIVAAEPTGNGIWPSLSEILRDEDRIRPAEIGRPEERRRPALDLMFPRTGRIQNMGNAPRYM